MTKEEQGILRNQIDYTKHLEKERKVLIRQLNLAKKTILAWGYAYEYGRESGNFSGPDWDKAIKLYQTCDDEMDLDSYD